MHLRTNLLFLITAPFLSLAGYGQKMPPSLQQSKEEPVIYTEGLQPDSSLYDGGLPHARGVHHFQVMRANRSQPPEVGSDKGWTYNHQPYMAYWNDQFYLQYLSGEYSEHTPPTRVMMTTSKNGKDWSAPEIVFPVYDLPEIKISEGYLPAGTKSVMHQRMGFYKAPNGKLLTLGFYSYTLSPRHSPNAGQGLGRVVREVKKDGTYGPIYFIRYNRHNGFNESNTGFPFYKKSTDKEFLAACEALLNDKLVTLQWWEEDRGKDGFYTIDPGSAKGAEAFSQAVTTSAGAGKAFAYYHRADGVVVGMWKNQWTALSADEGKTWTPMTKNKTFNYVGAKVWGQRLDDGNFAIVRNQTAGHKNRYPMVVMTSEDGHMFNHMFSLKDDMTPIRFQGLHKGIGPQYFRGIVEGNGNPPGDAMWVTYSLNKEDIWVASIEVPISGEEKENVTDDFEAVRSIRELKKWNLYVPQWAPVSLRAETKGNQYLELRDEDPYDYAKVERLFPKSTVVEVSFRLLSIVNRQGRALEIEVQDQRSLRPLRLRIDQDWLMFDQFQVEPDPVPFRMNQWANIRLLIDVEKGSYSVYQDEKLVKEKIELAVPVTSVERLVVRTGPFRGYTDAQLAKNGPPGAGGTTIEDLPGADTKVPVNIYGLDDVRIRKIK
jgi:hypothetical protein